MSKDPTAGLVPRWDGSNPSSTSTNLFSKASASFNRTPSKKARNGSSPLPYLNRQLSHSTERELDKLYPGDPARPPSRPDYLRTHSTPLDVHMNKLSLNTTAVGARDGRHKELHSVGANTIAAPYGNSVRKDSNPRSQGLGYAPIDMTTVGLSSSLPASAPLLTTGAQNPNVIYQHIHDMASKRISTLDYLRKAHEGRVYWFNTIHFSRNDLSRLPSFQPAKLARRAMNYMLLGLSIPTIIDVYATNTSNPQDFLRALNTLLGEFETFQQLHPPDGSSASSLSRARIPQMFKRSTHNTKARRTSSANEIGLPMQSSFGGGGDANAGTPSGLSEYSAMLFGSAASIAPTTASANTSNTSLPSSIFDPSLGSEDYTHLLTPSLPFDPDFYETFATLCDVLIDAYTRIISLVSTPSVCTAQLGDVFSKADARLRKVIVGGVVREFEESSRSAAKAEIAGVGRVVLGGLMAQ